MVAGTAVAGAALGATFSEEIENVLDGNGLSAPDSTAEAAEVATVEEVAETPAVEAAEETSAESTEETEA